MIQFNNMPKKVTQQRVKSARLLSKTRQIYKTTEKQEESNEDNDEASESSSQNENESGSQSSSIEIKPQNYAIKQMQFRERRGTKMNELMRRKKEEEQDQFWQGQGMQYFGDLDDGDQDGEDYVESSQGRDQFDSDFDQTESEHEEMEGENQEKIVDQDQLKERKRRSELMRKVNMPQQATTPPPSTRKAGGVKTSSSNTIKRIEVEKKAPTEQTSRYIHQVFSQEDLLGEAAMTEYFNYLSLQKLISIQCEKKDFDKRQHHIEGPKCIYHDRIVGGVREVSYELDNVKVQAVSDLSKLWK